jgi:glyoxylase-like metal-dependent hydrolase (beta-lactamase superfamily II)
VGEVTSITLAMPFRLGTVNCFLVAAGAGFVLIDTGPSNRRAELERELADAGCTPGNLRLIVLTHGDFDHTGNAAYLSTKYGARIAMHRDDFGMAERGDMFWNRSSGNALSRGIAHLLFRFRRSKRFRPDIELEDGADLSGHGFAAQVLSIPGHSKGSIGFLTANGDLFCGDLFENTGKPRTNSMMDNMADCEASVEKLQGTEIKTVYPGHGKPFLMDQLKERKG